MAVKREIRTTLALDGENEYKKALSEAQRGLRVLGSELKLASAEFETNGDQQAFLTAKSRTLRSEIAQQEEIVKSLEGAVKDAGEKYGETAKATDDYQIRLNGAKAALERMRRELDATDREAQDLGRDSVRVGRQIEDGIGDGAEQAKESLESMAAQMKQSLEEIKNSSFVTAAGSAWNMAQGVYQGFSGLERDTRDYRTTLAMMKQLAEKKGIDFSWVEEQARSIAAQTGDLEGAYKGMATLLNTGYDTNDMVQAIQNIKGALVDFPDTYTFDGLAEGLLQTIKTGTATGQYADLIQRLSYSTDTFNKAMKNSKTEVGDLQVALSYLSANGLGETAKKFEENNQEIIDANDAENHLRDSMATLGGTVAPVVTKITESAANVMDGINRSLVSVKENGLWGSLVEGEKRKSTEEDAEDLANYQQFGRWVDSLLGQGEEKGMEAGKASAFQFADGFLSMLKETFGGGAEAAIDYSDSYVQELMKQYREVHRQLIDTEDEALSQQLSRKEAELQMQIDAAMDGMSLSMEEINGDQTGRWIEKMFGSDEEKGKEAGKATAFEYADGFFSALKETFGAGEQDAIDYSDSYVRELRAQLKEVHEQLVDTDDEALIAQLSAREAELIRLIDEAMDGINQNMEDKGEEAADKAETVGKNVSQSVGEGMASQRSAALAEAQSIFDGVVSILNPLNGMTFGPTVAINSSVTRGLYDTPVSSGGSDKSAGKTGTQSLAVNLNVDGKSMAKVVWPHIDTLQGAAAERSNA